VVFGPSRDKSTADITSLLQLVERATEGDITPNDFVSPSIASLMMPLVKLLVRQHRGGVMATCVHAYIRGNSWWQAGRQAGGMRVHVRHQSLGCNCFVYLLKD